MRKVTQGDPLSISARDWNKLADIANGGFGATAGDGAPNLGGFGAIWVWVKNTSGSDRSRFDCMSLGDLVFDLETNAQQDVIFQAVTADPAKPPAILLEPIANNHIGRAVLTGLVYAKVATATSTSLLYAEPNASGHNLKAVSDGAIRLLAAPSTSAATLRPVLIGASSSGANAFVYELTEVLTLGSPSTAKADIYSKDNESTLIASDQDWVGNLTMFDDQEVGDRGICVKVGGKYYAVNAPGCGDGLSSSAGVYVGPTPPADTSLIWIDTSGL